MKKETELRIAALFDGEAGLSEKKELLAEIEQDPEARAYWNQLEAVCSAMRNSHVSDSNVDQSWARVKGRLDSRHSDGSSKILFFPKYAAAAAAILALGMGIWLPLRHNGIEAPPQGLDNAVYMVETELENATPIVYIDEPSGWTVVWVVEQDSPDQGHG